MIENIQQFGSTVCHHPRFVRELMVAEFIDPDDKELPNMVKGLYEDNVRQEFHMLELYTCWCRDGFGLDSDDDGVYEVGGG